MNHESNKKLNNKGFSLVELIIVVAIMAVLVGVLAPQYLKYVERSRESSDLSNIQAMVSAVEIYATDPKTAIVTDSLKCADGTVTADKCVEAALSDAGITTYPKMTSTKYKNWQITFSTGGMTFSGDDGDELKKALGR